MKKKTNEKIVPKLLKGLTGILFAVSTFILPGLLYAEEPGHVMPQEQVFLDPSQVDEKRGGRVRRQGDCGCKGC